MFGSLSGTAFRFSLRDVDKLRVLMLTNGASPSSQLFAMGYACASVAAGAAACGAVGLGTGAAIAVTAGAIGLMAYIFSVKLLHTGHVRYAWKEGRMGPNDPADFRLILSRTMRLCAIDREYRAGRYAQALDLLRAVVAAEQ
ncbi:hypothetical protein HYH03_007397 [Edaphochlamys debaryana]|nr:hypothetical protein HYH03_007397 [Edaphochlamys debaryana]|eukprot:KAG2494340.1 hypothetical protein HYH03_007397 [Edaphochlamys debaryana]